VYSADADLPRYATILQRRTLSLKPRVECQGVQNVALLASFLFFPADFVAFLDTLGITDT
jgi:hypothetical protein